MNFFQFLGESIQQIIDAIRQVGTKELMQKAREQNKNMELK
ncbi:hypothetical protein [Campylobacter jejuni]|nr:hypothetical protein [Campylobacter jejuni]UWU97971.1 hypothetical protein DSQ35_p45 [Campylobacter jejuni]